MNHVSKLCCITFHVLCIIILSYLNTVCRTLSYLRTALKNLNQNWKEMDCSFKLKCEAPIPKLN